MTERLNHTIEILEKVSFSKDLFVKELNKAINYLLPFEVDVLKKWIINFVSNKQDFNDVLKLV